MFICVTPKICLIAMFICFTSKIRLINMFICVTIKTHLVICLLILFSPTTRLWSVRRINSWPI